MEDSMPQAGKLHWLLAPTTDLVFYDYAANKVNMPHAESSAHEAALQYWETFLKASKPCFFSSQLDNPHPDSKMKHQQTTVDLDVSADETEKFCSQNNVTTETVFQTAWAIVINRYAGVEDVSFGYSAERFTSPAGKETSQRTIICRTQITADHSLSQTMRDIQTDTDRALAHQDCSILEIQERLKLVEPLFNSGLQIQRFVELGENGSPDSGPRIKISDPTENDMLAKVLLGDNGSIALSIRSNAQKFSVSHTANIAHTLRQTVSECLKTNSTSTIGELDICSRRDYEQVMSWNKTTPQPVEATFHQHFEAVAQKTPDAPAICSWDRNFTYSELDTLSTKLANRLVELGVKPEMLVLMCFDKSAYAVVSMLGIFKAGGAFVAIDPSYPASRIQAIMEVTKASVVVSEPAHCHLFEGVEENTVSLDSVSAEKLPAESKMARSDVSPSNIAYGVFTSGSTGAPKGIMIEHRALITAALSLAAPMRVSSTTRFLQFAAYTFDLCYGDIFVTLSQGGCICVPSEHERVNDLAGAIVRMDVNTACLIPSVARIFRPEDVPSLKNLLLGGEALLQESLELWAEKVNLVQMYGPSEATIWCTSQDLQADSKPNNIGRGLAARLWITNTTNHDQLCPIGCIGELLIEGPVLARGYLDAQQTKDNFIENPPWAQVEVSQRRRFYKTGDLVKYNPNGTVSFIGRRDTQVKFHGRRIELGEIEHHLSSHDSVRQSMIALPSAGIYAKHLVAIVVLKFTIPSKDGLGELKAVVGTAKETTDKEVAKVKDFLSSRVSSYMLPQYWVVVEDIPLMISGKMNRVLAKKFVESLTEEERIEETKATANSGHTSSNLDDPIEARLRSIWSHILDRKTTDIGVDQTFFSLGGDSFSAMELVASCKAKGLGLTVKDVLSSSTIREMASILRMGTEPKAADFPQQHRLKLAPIWWDVPTTA